MHFLAISITSWHYYQKQRLSHGTGVTFIYTNYYTKGQEEGMLKIIYKPAGFKKIITTYER